MEIKDTCFCEDSWGEESFIDRTFLVLAILRAVGGGGGGVFCETLPPHTHMATQAKKNITWNRDKPSEKLPTI